MAIIKVKEAEEKAKNEVKTKKKGKEPVLKATKQAKTEPEPA